MLIRGKDHIETNEQDLATAVGNHLNYGVPLATAGTGFAGTSATCRVSFVMGRKPLSPRLENLVQIHPGLAILRLAALLAEGEAEPDAESMDVLFEQVDAGFLLDTPPHEIWPELARGLMAPAPERMIRIFRECGALEQVLPEVSGLFGVPQIAETPAPVDLGDHLLLALAEAALCGAPLHVRFALLAMNAGKVDSPPEHLPVHYRHHERGRPRIEAMCARFQAPPECRSLALLALDEVERVHRVSKMRAGPVAVMLERLGAFSAPARFADLMTVCACDYRSYGDRSGQAYPKAALLDVAMKACEALDDKVFADDAQALAGARAEAIARAFCSQRWSEED
jgi:tRNA nucleotidyltransferase (CCA-adding enzyme)